MMGSGGGGRAATQSGLRGTINCEIHYWTFFFPVDLITRDPES